MQTNQLNNQSPLHNYESMSEEDYANLKFNAKETRPYIYNLDPLKSKGKSYGSIAANNVVSLVSGLAELGQHYTLPLFKPFAKKLAGMDLDPEYDDAVEKMKDGIRKDPQGFIQAAASGVFDEFKDAAQQGFINYAAEGAVNYVEHFSTSTKQLFMDTLNDYAKREGININEATDDEVTRLRSLALYDALVVSEAIPGGQALKGAVNLTSKGVYNAGKGVQEFLNNNFPPDNGSLQPISSGISKNINTNPQNKNNLLDNINQILVPIQGKTTKTNSLNIKDPDLSKISRRFGWGSKLSYRIAKRSINNLYKKEIYPKALDAKGDIFNDIKLLQPNDQVNVNKRLNEIWVRTGWMPGKNNVLVTEIDDSGIKFNYPLNNVGDFADVTPYNTMLHRMHLSSLNPKKGDPAIQLQDLIKHDDLFKLFPELKTLNIQFTKSGEAMGARGQYVSKGSMDSYGKIIDDPRGIIELNIKNLVGDPEDINIIMDGNKLNNNITDATQESIISTLFHEIQHVIQGKNNFLDFGRHSGIKQTFNVARMENAREVASRINTFNNLGKYGITPGHPLYRSLPDYYIQFYRNGEYDIVSDLAKVSPTEYPTLAGSNAPSPIKLSPKAAEVLSKKLQYELMEKIGAPAEEFMSTSTFNKKSELMKDPQKYFNDLKEGNIFHNIKQHFTYLNDLAEVEARLVQARLNLPFESRKKIPPYQLSEDAYLEMMNKFIGMRTRPYSASKPAGAAARLTLFDLLITGKNPEIKFTDLTSKGGIDPSKLTDLESGIDTVEDFVSKLQKNIKNSSLLKDLKNTKFKGSSIEKDLDADNLSLAIAEAITYQDFQKIFFTGLQKGALSEADPFIDGLNKIGLETVVPQIEELQSKVLGKLIMDTKINLNLFNNFMTPKEKEIFKNIKSVSESIDPTSGAKILKRKTRNDFNIEERTLLHKLLQITDYSFDKPLEMSEIDATRVAAEFKIGTDKIPQYIQGPGQSITIDNKYKF